MVKRSQSQAKPAADVDQLLGRLRLSHVFNWVLGALVVILAAVLIFRGTPGGTGDYDPAGAAEVQETDSNQQDESADQTESQEQASSAGQGEQASHVRGLEDDPMAVGSVDAPVVITEWTDYRCPYCALFAQETLPVLLSDYVESGQVRIEFNDVFFFGEDSFDAAVAARAAAKQGHYMEFIKVLYDAAPEKGGHPDMPRDVLIEFAQDAGVPDMSQFEADLDSEEIAAEVQASHQQAVDWGITSVPFFVVGDQAVAGAQPLEVFTQLIEESQN